ncbi:hypothetical protein RSOLAG22IIIB_08350 [Rhizoctonia solani]|uniref:F-box domain-containing protein n=1 Tax=Rhizoctonia solani TaxID=456999 RepID=A0A0K6FSJ3_9AGAM|nr:hypothetical protein RSOLAG22IIIB_08350 [Rhizoctonia solani]
MAAPLLFLNLPSEILGMIFRYCSSDTLCALSRLSNRAFQMATPILWEAMPVAQPLLNLIPINEVAGQADPMSRWSIYSDFVRQIDVGPMLFSQYQARVLLQAANSSIPLFSNLRSIYLNTLKCSWRNHSYVNPNLSSRYGSTDGRQRWRRLSYRHSGFFAIMALCPTVDTFFYGYSFPLRNFLDLECLLARAPRLSSLGICGRFAAYEDEDDEEFLYEMPPVCTSPTDILEITDSSDSDDEPYQVPLFLSPFDDEAVQVLLVNVGCCGEFNRFSPIGAPSHPSAYGQIRSLTLGGTMMSTFDHELLGSYLPGLESLTLRNAPQICYLEHPLHMSANRPNSFPSLTTLKFEEVDLGFIAEICKLGCITRKLEVFHMIDCVNIYHGYDDTAGDTFDQLTENLFQHAPNLRSLIFRFQHCSCYETDLAERVTQAATSRFPKLVTQLMPDELKVSLIWN